MPSPFRLRQRVCACMMAHGTARYERMVAERKRALFGRLESLPRAARVVEIGAGTGANLEYLPLGHGIRYTAVEPNPFMRRHLARRAKEAGVEVIVVPEPVEAMPMADGSADAVVCTLVLCSVRDQAAALAQVRRVLRPGGVFLFIEHVGAARETFLRGVQRAVRPLWRVIGDGCEPDRETAGAIESAGFGHVELERFSVRVPVMSPHLAGWAER